MFCIGRMEEKSIEIAFNDTQEGARAKGESWELSFANENGYLWAVYGLAPAGSEIMLTITGIPGSYPVACCATEWDAMNTRPMISEAVIELRSIQRSTGMVRIVAFNRGATDRHVVMGIVFPVRT